MQEVISRPKFVDRLRVIGKTAEQVVIDHLRHTEVIEAVSIAPTIRADPDDDAILACALGGKADYIVSGDPHLLTLSRFRKIPNLTVNDFLKLLPPSEA